MKIKPTPTAKNEEGSKRWSPVTGVQVLPAGKEGTRLYSLLMRQFGVYCEAHHPYMGGAWTEGGNYYLVEKYVHTISIEEREDEGMVVQDDMPAIPKREIEAWEADLRRERRKAAELSQKMRGND